MLAIDSSAGTVPASASREDRAAAPEGLGDAVAPADVTGVRAGWALSRAATTVLVVGLLATAALAVTALVLYERNETRLLKLRARELSLVLSSAVTAIQTPLASAAELADTTGGSPQKFKALMAPYVGAGRQFASASLWPLGSPQPAPSTVLGAPPKLASLPTQARELFRHARHTPALNVTGVLSGPNPSLGFEYSTPGPAKGYAVYAENPLPKNRRSSVASGSGFSDLNYALYLGHTRRPTELLVTNIRRFPIRGRQASDVVPFGDSAFTLVVTPNGSLAGVFFESVPWIAAIFGALVTLAAMLLTERLVRRQRYAEQLAGVLDRVAGENRQMYAEQRSIAQTLQHALLPDALPQFKGLRTSARYVPAGRGVDVGGDWYDVVAVDERHVALVIGDVSGHGLPAATTMASLRYAALAYAVEGSEPATVLSKLSDFVASTPHEYFATALCAVIDLDGHRFSVASAGHPPPLLLDGSEGRFIEFTVGPPIGVRQDGAYKESNVEVPPGAVLVAFTDGLVERRGELLDVGLERLRAAAVASGLRVDDLLSKLTSDLTSTDNYDDTAIVGIEWQT